MSVDAKLAQVLEQLANVREDIAEIKSSSRDNQDKADVSRARLHARLDKQQLTIAEIDKSVVVIEKAVESQREAMASLKKTLDDDIRPAVSDWNRMKTLGWGFSGLMVAVGITGMSVLMWAGDMAVTIARKWLRID